MAFQRKVDSGGGDVVKFEKPGDSITGYYVGGQDFPEGKFGPAIKHIFKTPKGIKVVFAKVNHQITGLLSGEVGKLVRLTFDSTKPSGKGNPTKIYTLDVDPEQALDSNELNLAADTVDDEPMDDADTDLDETPTRAAKAAPTGKAPSADARARAQALLNGNRKAAS